MTEYDKKNKSAQELFAAAWDDVPYSLREHLSLDKLRSDIKTRDEDFYFIRGRVCDKVMTFPATVSGLIKARAWVEKHAKNFKSRSGIYETSVKLKGKTYRYWKVMGPEGRYVRFPFTNEGYQLAEALQREVQKGA